METPEGSPELGAAPANPALPHYTLAEWTESGKPANALVTIAGADDLHEHYEGLVKVSSIRIVFAGFMDGRGFSHAGKLRQLGYTSQLIAGGDILADQWVFLNRCGFDTLEDSETASDARALPGFSQTYQADAREAKPLLLRKANT
ncbi:DUF934 domain-containing protein [Congregibacter brevis]|uniref:DUF934 domain-containing protein n=1 Tax=Congregibacter brevis TaxID=3081201 RepID=A0ABZ0IAX0_9GAMM|nr:DUF934 domain-containing protein [Congregibacter sp. IMCC45268]